MATITFQNLFRLYDKLAGMTGTATTEAEEFHKIYKLEVLTIPTHKTTQRIDEPDRVYKTELGKFQAVVEEIKQRHAKGQPVLLGTVSIEKNEIVAEMLKAAGIPCKVLNAKNHAGEGEIIAQAGRKGAVTVATNMAGRGVDILLGGNPPVPAEAEEVRALGGLHVIGTERHEARRIDNQLRGRAGRQGDPGSTQFYVSMEDDLMRIFGSERLKQRMEMLGLPDSEAIESRMLSRAIETAQKKVEGNNFDIRKHLLEYDDVLNKHRTVIYTRRRDILESAHAPTVEGVRPLKVAVLEAVEHEIEQLVLFHTPEEDEGAWNIEEIERAAGTLLPQGTDVKTALASVAVDHQKGREDIAQKRTALIEALMQLARTAYSGIEERIGDPVRMAEVERMLLVQAIDMFWVEHLDAIDHLRRGIGLQGYGQRDPLVEYKREAFRLFNGLLSTIDKYAAMAIFKIQIAQELVKESQQSSNLGRMTLSGPAKEGGDVVAASTEGENMEKVGRNDLCPCGSGKKYKKCHGA
jgi:preprotein translocase subunit SecA